MAYQNDNDQMMQLTRVFASLNQRRADARNQRELLTMLARLFRDPNGRQFIQQAAAQAETMDLGQGAGVAPEGSSMDLGDYSLRNPQDSMPPPPTDVLSGDTPPPPHDFTPPVPPIVWGLPPLSDAVMSPNMGSALPRPNDPIMDKMRGAGKISSFAHGTRPGGLSNLPTGRPDTTDMTISQDVPWSGDFGPKEDWSTEKTPTDLAYENREKREYAKEDDLMNFYLADEFSDKSYD